MNAFNFQADGSATCGIEAAPATLGVDGWLGRTSNRMTSRKELTARHVTAASLFLTSERCAEGHSFPD